MFDTDIEISGTARVGGVYGQPLRLETPGMLTIANGAALEVSARGHEPYAGPGAPPVPVGAQVSHGGGHAGVGGLGWLVSAPLDSTIYGDMRQPIAMGSGASGWGGGALRILVDTLMLEGEIRADGEDRGSSRSTGSGGSVWVTCASFSGTGRISANGGTGTGSVPLGGCGAGGRIAVEASLSTFTGEFETFSPTLRPGASGTVSLTIGGVESLQIGNGGVEAGEATPMEGFTRLTGDFSLTGGARVTRPVGFGNGVLEIVAGGEIAVGAGSLIELSARALGDAMGASGVSTSRDCNPNLPMIIGGNAHGGDGGNVEREDRCEVCLGFTPTLLTEFGSFAYGSPYNARSPGSGAAAGGAVILHAGGVLTIDGEIRVRAGSSGIASSGGSVFLSGQSVAGSGILDAAGGNAAPQNPNNTLYGGGGGGRVAMFSRSSITDQLVVQLQGGLGGGSQSGGFPGQQGTYLAATFPLNGVSGAFEEIIPPSSVRAGILESATALRVFVADEVEIETSSGPATFPCTDNNAFGPVMVDVALPGTYDEPNDLSPTLLPDGIYTSYLIHADAPDGSDPTLTGSMTFDRDILGIRVDPTSGGGNALLAGTVERDYAASDGPELGGGDSFFLSPDRRTLTVTLRPGSDLDQIVVITARRALHEWTP